MIKKKKNLQAETQFTPSSFTQNYSVVYVTKRIKELFHFFFHMWSDLADQY